MQAPHCSGFSCCEAQALGHTGVSGRGSQALEDSLHSCDTQTWLLSSMWDLPGSGIEPTSPALAGRLFTTEPPGRPDTLLYLKWIIDKVLLYSTWKSAQYCVEVWMGGEFGGEWMHVYVWLSPFLHLKLS